MNAKNLSKFDLALKQYNSIDLEKCNRVGAIVQGVLAFEAAAQPFMFYDEGSYLKVREMVRDSSLPLAAVGFIQHYIWYQ